MMNKFRGPRDSDFLLVSKVLKDFVDNASVIRVYNEDDISCLRLFASSYREGKERNPKRVPGTCEWVLNNTKFRKWRKEASSLLWISADPGCGKSVLAKAMVDEELATTETNVSSICYFFFKDEDAKRQEVSSAISAILHQLFIQQPHLLRHAIPFYKKWFQRLPDMFGELWDILLKAARDPQAKEIICILDALDECKDIGRQAFIHELGALFSSKRRRDVKMKLLVTSRPYFDIDLDFHQNIEDMRSINLKGEFELDKISEEIDLVIRDQIPRIARSRRHPFSQETEDSLIQKLTSMANRTYLWLHLMIEIIRKTLESTTARLEKLIEELPRNVNEAYEKILNKIVDPDRRFQARRLLHIMLAAVRPLTLREMNISFAIDERLVARESCKRFKELDLPSDESFREKIRNMCGLFVSIVDSKVFLIHLTAKEFLIKKGVPAKRGNPISGNWIHSFDKVESNDILAKSCMAYLMLEELNREFKIGSASQTGEDQTSMTAEIASNDTLRPRKRHGLDTSEHSSKETSAHGSMDDFLQYAGQHWPLHFQCGESGDHEAPLDILKSLFNTKSFRFGRWYSLCHSGDSLEAAMETTTSIFAASEVGLTYMVKFLLTQTNAEINLRNYDGLAPLQIAILCGKPDIVQLLLHENRCDKNIRCLEGETLLHLATSFHMHDTHDALKIMKMLLAHPDIDPNAQEVDGDTPLHHAVRTGLLDWVKLLLGTNNIDVNALERGRNTPLNLASTRGALDVVQCLLNAKETDINLPNLSGSTPLGSAIKYGHISIVCLLLERKDIWVNMVRVGPSQITALTQALWSRERDIVKLILQHPDLDVNMPNEFGLTPLMQTLDWGYFKLAELILQHPDVDVNIPDKFGLTPLMKTSDRGYFKLAELLLQKPNIDVRARNKKGETAFFFAVRAQNDKIAKLLLNKGNFETVVGNERDYREIHWAAQYGRVELLEFLIGDQSVDSITNDMNSHQALLIALSLGHLDLLTRLLDLHKEDIDVNAQNHDGETLLYGAIRSRQIEAIKLFLAHDNVDARIRNIHDVTVLSIAINDGDTEIVKMLMNHGVDLSALENGQPALHTAVLSYNEVIVQLLIESGVNVNALDKIGHSAIRYATLNGDVKIRDLLIKAGAHGP